MAGASGIASEGLSPGEVADKESAVRYRVYRQEGEVRMSYAHEGKQATRGERELRYHLGAGNRARTYLFSEQGFWFQAPIHWDAQEKRWRTTALSQSGDEIPLNVPVNSHCLNCHASGLQFPLPGTENKFPGDPFPHTGIRCERCHGPSDAHSAGKGTIVNPAKLPAERRDDICMECHLQGVAAVEQPGKHTHEFQPGERLSDYVHFFLLTSDPKLETPQALSQFEALSQSTCKKRSGHKMWCGTCHDPHREPEADQKAEYYRRKCLICHGDSFATQHYPDKGDCRPCHMPSLPSNEETHREFTDHRIMRFPIPGPLPQLQIRGKLLTVFPASDWPLSTARDYALAWETLAERGLEGASDEAEKTLRIALKEWPDDAELLETLGFLLQRRKQDDQARELYEHALKVDPLENDAAMNLGMLHARAGNLRRAVQLWQPVFERMPYRSVIGLNLAIAFCADGQKGVARKYIDRVLEFNPDYSVAKSLLQNMGKDPAQCKP